jgi:ABC-type transport system involved in Fe-S cluster assembly fused permease/ATPase subunit
MQPVKYLILLTILFTSCRSARQASVAVVPEAPVQGTLASVFHPVATNETIENAVAEEPTVENTELAIAENIPTKAVTKQTKKKAASFAQMKDMAKTGEIAMSNKDMKTLNKLEKHYKGDFQKFRADTFEFTTKAKIIAGIGLVGLLLAIFAGSGFGLFLFILAALAFILRYLDVIAF